MTKRAVSACVAGAILVLSLTGCGGSSAKAEACKSLVGQPFSTPTGRYAPNGDLSSLAPINCADPGFGKAEFAYQDDCLYYVQLQSGTLLYAKLGGDWQSVANPVVGGLDPATLCQPAS